MIGTQVRIRYFTLLMIFSLALTSAWAGKATVNDSAGVLGAGKPGIEAAAADAPFDVMVTTYNSMTSEGALDAAVDAAVKASTGNVVGIGVDTNLRRVHIASNGIRLTQAQVDAAQAMAGNKFKANDWAGGMVAAITDLKRVAVPGAVAPARSRTTADSSAVPANQGKTETGAPAREAEKSGGFPWMWLILGVVAFFIFRKFMSNRNQQNRGYNLPQAGMQNTNNPPPPPGGYDQNQQPGGGGMMRGGLLGGLGGGLMGYMLGRNAGATSQQNPQDQVGGTGYDPGSQGDGGFISGGDSGDFGGGDFGGGDSGDF